MAIVVSPPPSSSPSFVLIFFRPLYSICLQAGFALRFWTSIHGEIFSITIELCDQMDSWCDMIAGRSGQVLVFVINICFSTFCACVCVDLCTRWCRSACSSVMLVLSMWLWFLMGSSLAPRLPRFFSKVAQTRMRLLPLSSATALKLNTFLR